MKIVIAPDSFKGSCSTFEVANSIERGIRKICKDAIIKKFPVADGGEGTVDTLVEGTNGRYVEVEVTNPLGKKIRARYGIIGNEIAIIEMASASGLTLVNEKNLNPLITTTYGTGELIKFAMESGIRRILIGLGGSATNDGGIGMAQALGVSFKDKDGMEIGYGGGELYKVRGIDISNIHPLLKETKIESITDVDNPLCGLTGASHVFGPQKGADTETVDILDLNLLYFGSLIECFLGKKIIDIPGMGGAGGLNLSLMAFCNSSIQTGIDRVLDILDINEYLKDADLVITGEGKIDWQSAYGKVPVGVAKRAKKFNIPVIAIVGSIGKGADEVYSRGIDMILDIINTPMTLEESMANAPLLIENAASNAMRMMLIVDKLTNKVCKDTYISN